MALNTVEGAHAALVAALNASTAASIAALTVTRDADVPGDDVAASLNVVKNPQPAQVLAEQMGLGEDDVLVEFVQTFDLEWVVRGNDDATRVQRFSDGLEAIGAALYADRTLGGASAGLNLGAPNYANHTLSQSLTTSACVVPVRVSLRGLSPFS